jgi:hypothetical protein
MTRSIMLRTCPLRDLFPCATGRRILQMSLPAAAKFVALRVWDGRRRVLLGDTVPEVFDKLKTFGSSEFEERRKFRVHFRQIPFFSA